MELLTVDEQCYACERLLSIMTDSSCFHQLSFYNKLYNSWSTILRQQAKLPPVLLTYESTDNIPRFEQNVDYGFDYTLHFSLTKIKHVFENKNASLFFKKANFIATHDDTFIETENYRIPCDFNYYAQEKSILSEENSGTLFASLLPVSPPVMQIIDGNHRLSAYINMKRVCIPVWILQRKKEAYFLETDFEMWGYIYLMDLTIISAIINRYPESYIYQQLAIANPNIQLIVNHNKSLM